MNKERSLWRITNGWIARDRIRSFVCSIQRCERPERNEKEQQTADAKQAYRNGEERQIGFANLNEVVRSVLVRTVVVDATSRTNGVFGGAQVALYRLSDPVQVVVNKYVVGHLARVALVGDHVCGVEGFGISAQERCDGHYVKNVIQGLVEMKWAAWTESAVRFG